MTKSCYVIAFTILIGMACSLELAKYQQLQKVGHKIRESPTLESIPAVTHLCNPYSNRSQLVNQQDVKDTKGLRNGVDSMIGIDGLNFLRLLANNQNSQAWRMVTGNLLGIILFGLEFGVGFVISLFLWSFLLCCCCCKGCVEGRRTKGSLVPLVFLIAGLTIAIGSSIYGLIETVSIGNSVQKAGCSAALIPDDVLNGGKTADGRKFFAGFYNISSQMGELQTNLVSISSNFSILMNDSSNPTINNVLALCQTAKQDTIMISNNDADGLPLVLTYASPINSTVPTDTISSLFPSVLGSYSSQSGIVMNIYSSLNVFSKTLLDLRSNAQSYSSQISNINSQIGPIQQSASDIISSIQSADDKMSDYVPHIQDAIRFSNLSVKIFYGTMIGVSVLAILSAILVSKFDVCRMYLYLFCVILFLSAFIGFAIALGLTAVLPPLTWSCSYIENSMNSEQDFNDNFNFLIDQQTISYIGVCLPNETGDILSRIGIDAVAGINNLTSVINELSTFNVSAYKAQIYGNFSVGLSLVQDFAESRILDITDSSSLAILQKMADTSTASYQRCDFALFQDSWVPSDYPNSHQPRITCSVSGGSYGDETTCFNGVSGYDGCSGCMDTTQILNMYQISQTWDLMTDLGNRYGVFCGFNNELNNVWANYYSIKYKVFGPDVRGVPSYNGVLPRLKKVKSGIDNLVSAIDPALPNLFSNVLGGLNSINNIVDPASGLLAGLNCRLMGEDFQRLQQSVCGSLYKDIYVTRIMFGVASYGVLLALCFFVCVARGRKKQERESLRSEEGSYHSLNEVERRNDQINPYV